MSEFSAKRMIGICGACVAYYIGAGFATMQEVVQYEASYGSQFLIVIAVAAAIYIYTNLSFATNGNRMHIEHGGDIYKVYCGKKIGTFYDYFAAFFCYMCFIVKCSSANSVATELWGLPNGIGAAILTVAVIATAVSPGSIPRRCRFCGPASSSWRRKERRNTNGSLSSGGSWDF